MDNHQALGLGLLASPRARACTWQFMSCWAVCFQHSTGRANRAAVSSCDTRCGTPCVSSEVVLQAVFLEPHKQMHLGLLAHCCYGMMIYAFLSCVFFYFQHVITSYFVPRRPHGLGRGSLGAQQPG